MEETVALVRNEELVLARIPIASIDCRLNAYHTERLDRWTDGRTMGKDSLRVLPFGLWWLEHHRQKSGIPQPQCILWSESHTHRVHLGRPSLGWMLNVFERFPKVKRQCLIPHIKSGQPNDLLVFERGKNWSGRKRTY
jgi:hypothetical protein